MEKCCRERISRAAAGKRGKRDADAAAYSHGCQGVAVRDNGWCAGESEVVRERGG